MTGAFEAALAAQDLAAIRRIPKADLHTHGWANADRAYVREKTGHDIVPIAAPLASIDGMHAWAKANIGTLFEGAAGRRLGIEATWVRALRDGLTRIKFGDDVWMVTQGLGSPQQLVEPIVQAQARMAPNVEWIPQLGLSR